MWKRFTAWQCVCVCVQEMTIRATSLCVPRCMSPDSAVLWLFRQPPTCTVTGRTESDRMHMTYQIKKTHTHTQTHPGKLIFIKIFWKGWRATVCVSVLYMCLTLHVNPVHSEYTLSFYPHFQKHWWGLTGSAGKQIRHSINQPNVWINKRVVGD